MPATSLIVGVTTGEWDGAFNHFARKIRDAIRGEHSQEDVGQGEQIPTISGAKNRSGAGQPIPFLLGESMYTPILLGQNYTTVSGVDGEEQIFHGLYCLGYNDIDLKSVSLGIYKLSEDEKNGTSGNLDCTNYGYRTYQKTISLKPLGFALPLGSNVFYLNLQSHLKDNEEIVSVDSYSFAVLIGTWYWKLGSSFKRSVSVSASRSGNYIVLTAETVPLTGFYSFGGFGTATLTIRQRVDNGHFPYDNTPTRKGYYQQLELQQGAGNASAEVALYPQKVIQENSNTELMHPEGAQALYMQPFSAKYPQKVEIEVMFQNLVHFNDEGKQQEDEVVLCVGYSLDGGSTYQPFNAFSGGASGSAITVSDLGTTSDLSGSYRRTKFKGVKNKQMRFVASKTFTFGEVFNIPEGTVKCKNNVIEFKIWRETVDKSITDSKYQNKCFYSAIRTWCYDYKETLKAYETSGTQSLVIQRPIIEKYRKMTARLGFSIRAGEEINGTIDELNVRMMSRARYCTITTDEQTGEKTYTWSNDTKPTNNPASLALLIMQHPMRGEYAYTDNDFDMVQFGKFYEWCEQTDTELKNYDGRKYVANGVLSKQFKTLDIVNQILDCGHGKLIVDGNKYSVVWDKPDTTPVMILNNQNVLEAKNTKSFADEIDGYSCKFVDCRNDYQMDTQIFVPKDLTDPDSPNYKDPSEYKLESVELPWQTDVQRAYRMCMYMLACRKLRPEVWERKLGVDGALLDVGSICTVQDDTIVVGIGDGAQITEVNEESGDIVSIEVDYGFNVTDTTKTYGVKIQHSDSVNGVTVRTYELASFTSTGVKKTLVFAEPIDSATVIKPAENDIVSFGIFDRITTDAIVLAKKSNNDGTYSFSLVPYQDNIYESEYGLIPEYESNVTSPRDAGMEVSEELPPVTLDQVGAVAEAVMQAGTDDPPSAPTGLTAVAEEIGIQLKWIPVAQNGISNTIKHYVIEKSTDGGETWTALGTTFNSDYMYVFNRGTDKYPEATAPLDPAEREEGMVYLSDYRFRIKAVNIYGYESTYLATTITTSSYGTWKIPPLSIIKEVVDRTVILTAVYTGTVPKVYGLNRLKVWIKRNGNTDAEGGQSFNQILHVTPDDVWYTPEFNESVMGSESVNTEKNYHKFDENGTALTVPYETNSYKISHTLPLMGQCPRLYNGTDYVGITGDAVVVPSITEVEEVPASPVENQIILYSGETDEHFTEGKWYIYQNSWTELSDGFFIKYNGIATEDYKNGFYYVLDSDWTELTKKNPTMVTTEYVYKMTMFNESCEVYPQNAREANDTYVQALCTNIADIVHSHEHYKNLYVEKLSAINANLGMISQGGMGSFEQMMNCWALSDLSPEDSGVQEGVMRGTFRVGDENEYFRVTPHKRADNSRYYSIELKAGNIELTSAVDGSSSMDFTNGTYVYSNDRHSRMMLAPNGIVVQKYNGTDYDTWSDSSLIEDVSKVFADEKGNMIISNADKSDIPAFGYQVDASDTIYHFDDFQHPTYEEVGEGETASNPEGITCTGSVIGKDVKTPPLLDSDSLFSGTVSKQVGSFTGNIVFFSKADKVVTSGKGIVVSDSPTKSVSVETAIPLLIGYNDAMKETSTIDASKTVGEYLGLTQQQVNNVIFY